MITRNDRLHQDFNPCKGRSPKSPATFYVKLISARQFERNWKVDQAPQGMIGFAGEYGIAATFFCNPAARYESLDCFSRAAR
jgi:hypothetical protein